jgi:AraC family transcriptional regulator, melibiose operon regulatory protein
VRALPIANQVETSYGLRCWQGCPPPMGISHRHNDVEINYVVAGTVAYSFGGRRITLATGDLLLFWAAMPHQLIVSEAAAMVWLTLPLARFLGWHLPAVLAQPVLNGAPLLRQTDPSTHVPAMFARWQADLASPTAEAETIVLLELHAWLRRLVCDIGLQTVDHPAALPSSVALAASSAADQMAHYIAAHCTEPLRVATIAAVVALHPSYAMHVFRQTFGVSIVTYLLQHRIACAQRLLATTKRSIAEIAFASGFASISCFYSAFRRLCGTTPRAYRQALRSAVGSPLRIDAADGPEIHEL